MSNNLQVTSVITILRYKGKYLLVQRALNDDIFPGKWQNMGGKVELGETIEEAIQREVKEEVGFELPANFRPIFIQSYSWKKDSSSPHKLGIIFLIKLTEEPIVQIDKELNDYKWFSYEEIASVDTIGPDSSTGTMAQVKMSHEM